MREVRRYSDKTITIAAKRIRRALRFIPDNELSTTARVNRLVSYLAGRGYQPIDLVRPAGADALVALAAALPAHAAWTIDTEVQPRFRHPPKHVVIDSLVSTTDLPTLYALHETKSTRNGRGFAGIDYASIEMAIAEQLARIPKPIKLSNTWQRVVDRVMRMPGLA